MPSYPAAFNSCPKKPPKYESVNRWVTGDWNTTTERIDGAWVPVSGPTAKMSGFAGSYGAALGSWCCASR